jgi:hypothetical protein
VGGSVVVVVVVVVVEAAAVVVEVVLGGEVVVVVGGVTTRASGVKVSSDSGAADDTGVTATPGTATGAPAPHAVIPTMHVTASAATRNGGRIGGVMTSVFSVGGDRDVSVDRPDIVANRPALPTSPAPLPGGLCHEHRSRPRRT